MRYRNFQYDKLIQYVEFDVTNLLRKGENVVGVEIGNGWFIKNDDYYTFHFPPFMPPNPNPYKPYGKSLVFAMSMEVVYGDGSKEEIVTDNTFRVAEHKVEKSNVFGSEYIDGRKEKSGWSSLTYDDSAWSQAQIVPEEDEPKGELVEQSQPPIKVIHTYQGIYLHDFEDGKKGVRRKVYDFTQNMSAMLEVQVRGKAGEVVRFYPAEKLSPEGDADQMAKNCGRNFCWIFEQDSMVQMTFSMIWKAIRLTLEKD